MLNTQIMEKKKDYMTQYSTVLQLQTYIQHPWHTLYSQYLRYCKSALTIIMSSSIWKLTTSFAPSYRHSFLLMNRLHKQGHLRVPRNRKLSTATYTKSVLSNQSAYLHTYPSRDIFHDGKTIHTALIPLCLHSTFSDGHTTQFLSSAAMSM